MFEDTEDVAMEDREAMDHKLIGPLPTFTELLAQLDVPIRQTKHNPAMLHPLRQKPTTPAPLSLHRLRPKHSPTLPDSKSTQMTAPPLDTRQKQSNPVLEQRPLITSRLLSVHKSSTETEMQSATSIHPSAIVTTLNGLLLPPVNSSSATGSKHSTTHPISIVEHNFGHDYMALVPPDQIQIQIWHTQR